MHYIVGTSFIINPALKLGFGTKKFKPDTIYMLISIKKNNDKFVYTFFDRQRQKVEMEFLSCRDADLFISNIKNEKIPDYDTVKEEPISQ